MALKTLKWVAAVVGLIAALSGCSLAVDSGGTISLPLRKGGFQAQDGLTTERLKDFVEDYRRAL